MSTWAQSPDEQRQEAVRPQVYDKTDAPAWWSNASTGAAMLVGANAMRHGVGFGSALGQGFLHPASMAGMFANPKARWEQSKADHHFISNARQHDMQAGLPRKLSMPLRDLVSKVSSERRALLKYAAAAAGPRRNSPRLPREWLEELKGLVQPPKRDPPTFMGDLGKMGRRAGLLAVGAGALGVGVLGYRAAVDSMNSAAEARRFQAARQNLGDFSRLGDHGLRYMAETDPQAVEAHLRNTFKVINRYSPSVAADPRLAEQYLLRLGGDPRYGTPADQYAEEVKRLVDLENAIQKSRPDLFDGAASYARNLL